MKLKRTVPFSFKWEFLNETSKGYEDISNAIIYYSSNLHGLYYKGMNISVPIGKTIKGDYKLDIKYTTDNSVDGLRRDVRLIIVLFANVKNKKNEPVGNQVGEVDVNLRDIYMRTRSSDYTVTHDVKVYNAKGFIKGKFTFTFPQFTLGVIDPFTDLQVYDYISTNERQMNMYTKLIRSAVMKSVTTYENLPVTYKGAKYIHMPLFKKHNWIAPGAAFSWFRAQKPKTPNERRSHEEYWLNILDIVFRRRYKGKTIKQARQYFENEADDVERSIVLAYALMVFATYCNYISDKIWVIREGKTYKGKTELSIESFDGTVRIRIGGDCEDLALEIFLGSMEVLTSNWQHLSLVALQAIRKKFICMMVLMGVSGKQLSDSQLANAKLGGHMAAMLYPVSMFEKFYNQSTTRSQPQELKPYMGSELYKNNNGPLKLLGRNPQNLGKPKMDYGMYSSAGLYPLALEGTGMMSPDMFKQKSSAGWRIITQGSEYLFGNVKHELSQQRNKPNVFYKVVVSGLVSELTIEGGNTFTEIIFGKRRKGKPPGVGIDFTSFFNGSDKTVFFPVPAFTKQETEAIKQIMTFMVPVPIHRAPKRRAKSNLKNVDLIEIEKDQSLWNGRLKSTSFQTVDMHVRSEILTKEFAKRLKRDIKRKPQIVSMTHFFEPVTDNLHGWIIRFEVNVGNYYN